MNLYLASKMFSFGVANLANSQLLPSIRAFEIPIYLLNATLFGVVFGMLRMATGSVVVPSVGHAIWNGIDYPLFGFGEKVGALGIEQTHIYGPEVGLLGLVLNLAFVSALWFWISKR